MTALAWVVGGSGLLGGEVLRALRGQAELVPWTPAPLPWTDGPALDQQLAEASRAFVRAAARERRGWALLWCAGAGVVGTPAAALAAEVAAWERLLEGLGRALASEAGARDLAGGVILASSAGGVYAASGGGFVTEDSPCRPLSPYGESKLRQEQALAAWAVLYPRVSTLVMRISNLYGPGQKMDKPQGLISQMARCAVHRRAVHIYVPLDTMRDYLFAEDAATALVRWTRRLGEEAAHRGAAQHVAKICASERETTISTLAGVFRRVARRQIRIVCGQHPLHAQQPPRLRFRSVVWPDEPPTARTGLLEGVSRVYRHQLGLFQAGALPPPSFHQRLLAPERGRP